MPSPKPSPKSSRSIASPSAEAAGNLLEIYKIAVDEYRFQVELNWKRTQYFLAFNVALLAVSASIANNADSGYRSGLGGLYVVGALASAFCVASSLTQHNYYRGARDRMTSIGKELGIGDMAVATTPGSGSGGARFGSVTTLTRTILSLLVVLNIAGLLRTILS